MEPSSPQPLRDLSPTEKKYFQDLLKIPLWILKNKFPLLVIFGLLDLSAIYYIVAYLNNPSYLILGIYFAIILVELGFLLEGLQAKSLNSDLNSKVFCISGNAVKEIVTGTRSGDPFYYITVGNIKFDLSGNHLEAFYKAVNNGESVEVEYSPESLHIWKIYKKVGEAFTPDLGIRNKMTSNKIWLMIVGAFVVIVLGIAFLIFITSR